MRYMCPECKGAVSARGGVVVVGELAGSKVLFFFDPRPGCYGYEVAEGIEVPAGEMWEFSCPLCRANLTTKFNKKLARLDLVDGDEVRRVVFSKVADEQATFVLGGDDLEAHGRDSISYIDKKE